MLANCLMTDAMLTKADERLDL